MDIIDKSRKEVGVLGEKVVAEYLKRHGFKIRDINFARKTGELDIIAEENDTLHFVEVKTILVDEFPDFNRKKSASSYDTGSYDDPSLNLHESKIRKVARTGEWYVLEKKWEGEWQVDGALVWMRRGDNRCLVSFIPQIV